jgi:hypothetical protein
MNSDRNLLDDPSEVGASRRKKRWSEFSPRARAAIVVGAILELIMTTLALRDLARRPARGVRGWKFVWVLVFFVQPIGPPLYFLVGRRRAAD